MEYNEEQLNNILGTGNKSFTKYRVFSVDNGVDIRGTGATGDFVEKKYDSEKKQVERIPFAPEFEGIIISSQAQLVDKAKYPTWRTDEFDPTNVNAEISIFPLKDGQFIKNETGEIKKTCGTYQQIKSSRRVEQPDGSFQNTYNYFIVLYVVLESDEIIKLKFKGTARGNYFDYSKSISSMQARIYNILTKFSTYTDKTTGKYTIRFQMVLDKQGSPVGVDPDKVREMRIQIANQFMAFKNKQIDAPKSKQIETEPHYEPDNSAIKDSEVVEEDDIKIEDIPS